MKKVCIIYGGPSKESEVSVNTAKEILKNISQTKYEITLLYIDRKLKCSLEKYEEEYVFKPKATDEIDSCISVLKGFDLCFLALHGEFGEDGTIQKIFEREHIKYTGSDSVSSALCFDKYASSMIVNRDLDICIPKTILWKKESEVPFIDDTFNYPLFLKPNKQGSSIGVSMVKNREELEKVLQKVNEEYLIQEAILDAVEVSCGLLEKEDGKVIELPPVEIAPKLGEFFDYDSKYCSDGAKEIVPPVSISSDFSKKISEMSVKIHKLLGCSLYSRSDYLIKDDVVYYLETNTLPGLTSTSLLPKECLGIGLSYVDLLEFLITNSL